MFHVFFGNFVLFLNFMAPDVFYNFFINNMGIYLHFGFLSSCLQKYHKHTDLTSRQRIFYPCLC